MSRRIAPGRHRGVLLLSLCSSVAFAAETLVLPPAMPAPVPSDAAEAHLVAAANEIIALLSARARPAEAEHLVSARTLIQIASLQLGRTCLEPAIALCAEAIAALEQAPGTSSIQNEVRLGVRCAVAARVEIVARRVGSRHPGSGLALSLFETASRESAPRSAIAQLLHVEQTVCSVLADSPVLHVADRTGPRVAALSFWTLAHQATAPLDAGSWARGTELAGSRDAIIAQDNTAGVLVALDPATLTRKARRGLGRAGCVATAAAADVLATYDGDDRRATVLTATTLQDIAAVDLGVAPGALAMSGSGRTLAVAVPLAGEVIFYDLPGLQNPRTVGGLGFVGSLTFGGNDDEAYVATASAQVLRIHAARGRLASSQAIPGAVDLVSVGAQHRLAVLAKNIAVPRLMILDDLTLAVVGEVRLPLLESPGPLCVVGGRDVVIGDYKSARLVVIDVAGARVIESADLPGFSSTAALAGRN